MNVDSMLRDAERINRERDEGEHAAGLAAPSDGPLEMTLRTVELALDAGMRTEDWRCVAEAVVMLRDAMKMAGR